jgi:hypothetical protein
MGVRVNIKETIVSCELLALNGLTIVVIFGAFGDYQDC